MNSLIELNKGSYRVIDQIGYGASSKVYLVSKLCTVSQAELHQLPTSTGQIPELPMEELHQSRRPQNYAESRQSWSIGEIKEVYWPENNLNNQKDSTNSLIHPLYALKEILIQSGQPDQLKKECQFKTELSLLRKLNHPGILKILDWSLNDKSRSVYPTKLHMVTEWGSGGNLLNLIDLINEKKIFQQKKIRVFTHLSAQIIAIIEYLQSMGISHRDIKAENFILDSKYQIKLIDFGLAEIYDSSKINSANNETHEKQSNKEESKRQHGYIGSRHYISPEMIERSRRDCSSQGYYSKTDIWSLGILMYYMFAKSYPFEGTNNFFIIQAIKKKQPNFSTIMDQNLRQLLRGMLEKRPEDRWELIRIKQNQFFKDIQWDNIFSGESPLTELDRKGGEWSLFYKEEVIVKIEDQAKRRLVELKRRNIGYNGQKNSQRNFQTSIKFNSKGEMSMNENFPQTKVNIKFQSINQIIQNNEERNQTKTKQLIHNNDNNYTNQARNYITIGKPNSAFKYLELLRDTKLEGQKQGCRISWPTQRQGAKLHPNELQIQFKNEEQQQSFFDAFTRLSKC